MLYWYYIARMNEIVQSQPTVDSYITFYGGALNLWNAFILVSNIIIR